MNILWIVIENTFLRQWRVSGSLYDNFNYTCCSCRNLDKNEIVIHFLFECTEYKLIRYLNWTGWIYYSSTKTWSILDIVLQYVFEWFFWYLYIFNTVLYKQWHFNHIITKLLHNELNLNLVLLNMFFISRTKVNIITY